VSVLFAPHGGPARGVFLINGELIETELLNPNSRNSLGEIYSFEVVKEKELDIITFPEPGSFYPVSLIFKEINNDN